DRVFWVSLASVTHGELLPQTIAGPLGVIETPDTTLIDGLTNRLAIPVSLLVLDNCEHLIDACAEIVEHLLSMCPELRILATSREPLQVAGEHQWRVPPLALPRSADLRTTDDVARAPAVRLFLERAQAVVPDFRLTSENAPNVAEICTQLAGIPLALELAAARVHILTIQQILTRLEGTFRLLSGSSRAAPARQQTLQATLDWSYDLLSEEERVLFRRLAVFAGGFTLEAAEAVCGAMGNGQPALGAGSADDCRLPIAAEHDVLEPLGHLVDKSLVMVEADGPAARYSLLEPLRQYAHGHLIAAGEGDATRVAHAAWCRALAEQAAPQLRGPAQVDWLTRLAAEQDNLRAALRWAEACGDVMLTVRLATALVPFWEVRGAMGEGRRWLEAVLTNDPPRDIPPALGASVLLAAGRLAFWQADLAPAARMLEESLDLGRAADDGPAVAASLTWLGLVSNRQRESAKAEQHLTASLALLRMLRDGHGTALTIHGLGSVASNQGAYERALPFFEESLQRFQALGDLRFIAIASFELGTLLVIMAGGDLERAGRLVRDGLQGLLAVGDRGFTISGLLTLAEAEAKLGRRLRAARLLGVTAALRDTLGVSLSPLQREREAAALDRIRPRLSQVALAAAVAEGRVMTVDQAIAEALRADQTAEPLPTTSPRGSAEALTPREREVASLLAQGATDREIAAELVIAVGTAGVHIHHILGKLGLQSRWQVAAWAVEQGLVQDPA
ncbi:MAG: tetratricopeptide repeat protein, partial [Dehalococcoidia bacterium]